MRSPEKPLPFPKGHENAEAYVSSLLDFVTSCEMHQTLCGGVHILDFLTREPDLYETVLPFEWREWLRSQDIYDILDLLMREDVESLLVEHEENECKLWRRKSLPPKSLLEYIRSVRNLLLDRSFVPKEPSKCSGLDRIISVGMKPKKMHEVEKFASFIDDLTAELSQRSAHNISHLVDFGSGQNYLGRVLASPLYRKRVIAIESKQLNIDGAKAMDVSARLAKKNAIWRNKKLFRLAGEDDTAEFLAEDFPENQADPPLDSSSLVANKEDAKKDIAVHGHGRIQYVGHVIHDGDLADVINLLEPIPLEENVDITNGQLQKPAEHANSNGSDKNTPDLMVISLHSCGNLLHHGLRSLSLNPSVKAVAMVGCCYNLCTERLGPATHKLPSLRYPNLRLGKAAAARDPHGFPMSERLARYRHARGVGVRLNITARMMAVQASQNWGPRDCESFFTRHFYRALLQRVFVDRGFVAWSTARADGSVGEDGGDDGLGESGGQPVILGSLRKSCYASFVAYVRGALAKLLAGSERREELRECMEGLTDQEIESYEERFRYKRHELSTVWSLMAFSAGVLESLIVVDRWLYLKEQPEVDVAWVEAIFDYKQSPRNLAVVGVKK